MPWMMPSGTSDSISFKFPESMKSFMGCLSLQVPHLPAPAAAG
jgi:hypothetical protein